MEKNSNVSEDESEGDEKKNQHGTACDDEFGGIFYDGIADFPFICSSNGGSIDFQEREHFIWILKYVLFLVDLSFET